MLSFIWILHISESSISGLTKLLFSFFSSSLSLTDFKVCIRILFTLDNVLFSIFRINLLLVAYLGRHRKEHWQPVVLIVPYRGFFMLWLARKDEYYTPVKFIESASVEWFIVFLTSIFTFKLLKSLIIVASFISLFNQSKSRFKSSFCIWYL